jgi:uncharacterized protein YkwD
MTAHARTPRQLLALILAFALLLPAATVLTSVATEAPASAGINVDRQKTVQKQVNTTRRNNGRRALKRHTAATKRAQKWAVRLAKCKCLQHRNSPFGAPSGWKAAAENVGRGYSLSGVHRAFLRSSRHKANILNRRMTHIAVGVVKAGNGEFFVVQGFYDMT